MPQTDESDEQTERRYATDDVMVWAKEFCAMFAVQRKRNGEPMDTDG